MTASVQRARQERAVPRRMSPADALFGGTQQRVLGLLFGQPGRSFYANELIALTRAGSGAVQRELARLVQSELVTVRQAGNQKHYQANSQSPIFEELCAIARKTVGLAEPLGKALAPFSKRIRGAFIFGSVASGEDTASSDIDLLVVSDDLTYPDLFASLEEVSRELGRSVNPTILSRKEIAKRLSGNESFLRRVMGRPRIWLMGSANELGI